MAIRLWKFLTDIREWDWKQATEVTKTGAESAKAVLDLAKTVNEKKADVSALKPYVENLSSLLDALNSPLAQIVKDAIPFAPIAVTILSLICEATKKEPTLEQCVALVVQAAYLESLRSRLQEDAKLLEKIGEVAVSQSVTEQIRKLGDLELDDREARKAILFFQESEIAKEFSKVLEARLLEAGVKPTEVRAVSEQVFRGTNDHIQTVLAELGEKVNPLVKWYTSGGQGKFEQYFSIEEYLRDVISPESTIPVLRDRWRVFNEPFTLKEIYVPLKVQFIGKNGEPEKVRDEKGNETNRQKDPVVLDELAKSWLNNPDKQGTVLFIQGHPGRGKSAFCQMFAEWVRENQHPNWTPILIRLRDVRSLEKDFEETLRKAVDRDFARTDNGWLTDRNTRFLFLLDGFDELLMEGRTSGGLEDFLEQVEKFQRSCQTNSEKGHRVLITGRTLALQSIERKMPNNLDRVELLEMDALIQGQWFAKWLRLFGSKNTNAFQQFLRAEQCPERVQKLAQEPLLLYLLAAMHRDGKLDLSVFAGTEGAQAKIRIYEKTIDWVLTKQRQQQPSDENITPELTELQIEDLRTILAEAGLCVVQSSGECAPIKMIETRLKDNSSVQNLLEEARQKLKDNPLRNALAAFYLQPGSLKGEGGSVEFIHKSFGEFLCAERLKNAIESWTEPGRKREKFYVPTDQFNREIYDLLGSPVLSPEIVEYLMALLNQSEDFKPVELFERLNEFYERWCDGIFIDELPDKNLPQQKMRSLREQLPNQENSLGIRQVDVYAGLNVMILLLELHRYAQAKDDMKEAIAFYPCGKPGESTFDRKRLLRLTKYGMSIDIEILNILSDFLEGANLSGAWLDNVEFNDMSLKNIDLSGSFLGSTSFVGSKLSNVNFSNAYLCDANFGVAEMENIDFSHATLLNASFEKVTIRNAVFMKANLNDTNFRSSDLSTVNFGKTNLNHSNFSRAFLSNTDFSHSDLLDTDFRKATFSDVSFDQANLSGIDTIDGMGDPFPASVLWDSYTDWEGIQGIETARNIPEGLKKQLGLE